MKVLLLLVAILPAALFGVGCTTTKTVNVGTPVALGDFNDPETKHLAGISVVSVEHKTVRSILGLEKLVPNLGLINTLQDNFLVDERSEKYKSLAERAIPQSLAERAVPLESREVDVTYRKVPID